MEKNEVSRAWGMCGAGERFTQGFGGESWGKETTREIQA